MSIFSSLLFLFIDYFLVGLKTVKKIPYIHCSFLYLEIPFLSEDFHYLVKVSCGFILVCACDEIYFISPLSNKRFRYTSYLKSYCNNMYTKLRYHHDWL